MEFAKADPQSTQSLTFQTCESWWQLSRACVMLTQSWSCIFHSCFFFGQEQRIIHPPACIYTWPHSLQHPTLYPCYYLIPTAIGILLLLGWIRTRQRHSFTDSPKSDGLDKWIVHFSQASAGFQWKIHQWCWKNVLLLQRPGCLWISRVARKTGFIKHLLEWNKRKGSCFSVIAIGIWPVTAVPNLLHTNSTPGTPGTTSHLSSHKSLETYILHSAVGHRGMPPTDITLSPFW